MVRWTVSLCVLQLNNNGLVEEARAALRQTSHEEAAAGASGIQTCTRLIRNVACDGALVSQLVDKRTLKIVAEFAMTDPALNTRINCAVILCEITRHKELLLPFVDNGGLAVCFTLMQVCVVPVVAKSSW